MGKKRNFWFRSLIIHSPKEVFKWHLRLWSIERLIPASKKMKIFCSRDSADKIQPKFTIHLKIFGLFWTKIVIQYSNFTKSESLTLRQVKGIFSEFKHETQIISQSTHDPNSNASEVVDKLELSYSTLLSILPFFNHNIKSIYRKILERKHDMINQDIAIFQKYPFKRPFKVLVDGCNGPIAKSLVPFLEFMGHDVWSLSKIPIENKKAIYWDPKSNECSISGFEGFDVIIYLPEEELVKTSLPKKKSSKILTSYSKKIEGLIDIMSKLKVSPKRFLLPSTIPGTGFYISEICKNWDQLEWKLEKTGTRVNYVHLKNILGSSNGILKKMLYPLKKHFGSKAVDPYRVNSEALDDVLRSIYHIMMIPKHKRMINTASCPPLTRTYITKG